MNWIFIVTWTILVPAPCDHKTTDEFERQSTIGCTLAHFAYEPKKKVFDSRESAFVFLGRAKSALGVYGVDIDSVESK